MTTLSDNELLDVYKKATYFALSEDFVHLIEDEIQKRKLTLPKLGFEVPSESDNAAHL